MSERIPSFEQASHESIPDLLRTYRAEIIQVMEEARPSVVSDLSDFRPDLKDAYTNKVEIAEIPTEGLAPNASNALRYFMIQEGGESLMRAVFKPFSGENPYRKAVDFVDELDPSFYIREVAGSVVDEAAQLYVGPPTIIKEIGGEIGSLRPYVPSEVAETPTYIRKHRPDLDLSSFYTGAAWKKMACIDELTSNCDRTEANYLVYLDHPDDGLSIDLGNAFYPARPNDSRDTVTYFRERPDESHLDDQLAHGLAAFLARENELLAPLFDDQEGPDKVMLDTPGKRIARLCADRSRRPGTCSGITRFWAGIIDHHAYPAGRGYGMTA
jgi:hypothetical protein